MFLFKQGADPRGVFGVGEIVEPPRLQIDQADIEAGERHRAKIRFDKLVDPSREFLIDFDTVEA
ncbi:hypothetical protein ACQR1Q_34945 [Bradyrhizobium oligotrophicum]|uniref:hypothetical protein n=1 Tax=Bradyrhizobium oligotrophicum TaxID=44255 RepID=UPI003EBBB0C2